ncbi:hypothetical protein M2152_002197 [Microbacteriaceae bacterium SG_E_30_P1]|uniref:Uncharacterized protein n=1 Tax=Antiquaquibacter oligotrophicus TaxID=2880260 RepID=A0ABT6KPU6_9MICO|nr:hypothetical protein [Antiquaquibacter oligotrophicus]MDH6182015.1 hypothetical protein [Antiquaquibacter oligotrophicus]UDF12317.1 hypothetical protein LH407_09085 [Antiquaquibacter oligotrophicus]
MEQKSSARTVLSVFFVLTSVASIGSLVVSNAVRASDASESLLTSASWLLGGLAVALALILLLSNANRQRRNALAAEFPNAIIWNAASSPGLAQAISQMKGTPTVQADLPNLLTVVADADEVRVFGGHPKRLRLELVLPSGSIVGLRHGKILSGPVSFNGVELETLLDDATSVRVPLVVTGGGLGGVYAASAEKIANLAASLHNLLPRLQQSAEPTDAAGGES